MRAVLTVKFVQSHMRWLIIIFFILLVVLLIGQRFGFEWAGGDGFYPHGQAVVLTSTYDDQVGDIFERGETIKSNASYLFVDLDGLATVALDERTDLEIESLRENEITLRLYRGRIMLHVPERSLQVKTNYTTETIENGSASIVNYDFREIIGVYPVDAHVKVNLPERPTFVLDAALEIHETPPVSITSTTFDPISGAGAGFYLWVEEVKQ